MIKFYNVLTRKKEPFRPLQKKWVGLYTCGPTVYNFAHIGNLRTYIFEDVLRRTLEYSGYRVRHVMNITDVEDKIIRGAQAAKKNIFEFVEPYERAFFQDLKKLNIEKAWKYPRATKHIPEMIALIRKLLKRGLAYSADGSIYFDISKFKNYGRLSRVKTRELKSGTRVDLDEYAKKDAQDFVLWKAAKPQEPSWDAHFDVKRRPIRGRAALPIGLIRGRPGWHIECSAMSMKYLGPTFDIHTGGVDNVFPHHENEIAQSEGATGKKFVRYFIEGEHLLVDGEKMAKSLGNIFTLRDIESRGFSPLAFRYLMLTSHYRSKLNFSWKSLEASQSSLNRLYDLTRKINSDNNLKGSASLVKFKKKFDGAILDDLNLPQVLAVIWDLLRQYNKNTGHFNPQEALSLLYKFDKILGFGLKSFRKEILPSKIRVLVKKREAWRKKKEWREADKVRKKIQSLGYLVEDTPQGPRVKK